MTRLQQLAAGAAALLTTTAAGTALAQSGSYQSSCRNAENLNYGWLRAQCPDGQGRWKSSAIQWRDCRGDIRNDDGVLQCRGARPTSIGYVHSPTTGVLGAVTAAIVDAITPDELWRMPVNQRQAYIDQRIDAGVRDGSLTRTEARQLRSEYRDIARVEARYRSNGLNDWERADLDRRMDHLSTRLRLERRDGQERGDWQSINQRQVRLDARIDAGVRDGSLTRAEAAKLRQDFREIARMEARYRSNGLTAWERGQLDREFDALSSRIRQNRNDPQVRGSAGGNVNARQAELDRRIDAGVRDGTLTRAEAQRLRGEYREIVRIEARYRTNGLSSWERNDLDRRLDRLTNEIRGERYDRQTRSN